uniref:Zinc finger protein 774 n=1 Tax=Sciurus vulgaris TaxID=55149 RepID=A0A8D2B2X1_SCIVU
MWLGTSGKSGLPGHCLKNSLQRCHPAQLEEWALKGISRPSAISQLEQKESPWVLPLQNLETRTILRESHTGPFILHTRTFLYLIEINQ